MDLREQYKEETCKDAFWDFRETEATGGYIEWLESKLSNQVNCRIKPAIAGEPEPDISCQSCVDFYNCEICKMFFDTFSVFRYCNSHTEMKEGNNDITIS